MKCWALAVVLLSVSSAMIADEIEPDPAVDDLVALELGQRRSERELNGFAGGPPTRCLPSGPSSRVCIWKLDNSMEGWYPLAKALDTSDRLNLICELGNGGDEAMRTCTANVQRSNRESLRPPRSRYGKRLSSSDRRKHDSRNRELASAALARAKSLYEISHLLGDVPQKCVLDQDREEQLCIWKASRHTFGQGTLAAYIGGADVYRKKIRLHCTLPSDGSPRTSQSCRVMIGD